MNYYEKHLGDYARDTGHLSQAEHGAYNLLLDRYYATEQGIPEGIVYPVARATKPAERAVVDRVLAQFFRLKNGRWLHGRVEEEIAKVHAKSQKARDAAAKRWHSDGNANASPEHGVGICESHPLQSPDTSNQTPSTEKRARKRAEDFTPPGWVPSKEWGEFLESRKKHPPTVRAKELLVIELGKLRDTGNDPAKVLEQSTRNGWRDLFPLRSGNGGSQANRKLSLSEESERDLARFEAGSEG